MRTHFPECYIAVAPLNVIFHIFKQVIVRRSRICSTRVVYPVCSMTQELRLVYLQQYAQIRVHYRATSMSLVCSYVFSHEYFDVLYARLVLVLLYRSHYPFSGCQLRYIIPSNAI